MPCFRQMSTELPLACKKFFFLVTIRHNQTKGSLFKLLSTPTLPFFLFLVFHGKVTNYLHS
jgi:hypothetical protein